MNTHEQHIQTSQQHSDGIVAQIADQANSYWSHLNAVFSGTEALTPEIAVITVLVILTALWLVSRFLNLGLRATSPGIRGSQSTVEDGAYGVMGLQIAFWIGVAFTLAWMVGEFGSKMSGGLNFLG